MQIWKSPDGSRWINLDHLSAAYRKPDGSVGVLLVADSPVADSETVSLRGDDAESFLAAIAAFDAPALDPAQLAAIIERLDNLDGDMATVGGQRLVEIVRDLAKLAVRQ
jgi:hypothetical protein